MNTNVEYRRRMPQPQYEQSMAAPPGPTTHHLAISADPSLPPNPQMPSEASMPAGSRIAWVRPTDLHAYASHAIARGIDLQTELMRRARRSPARLSRAVARAATSSRSTTPATIQEGIQL